MEVLDKLHVSSIHMPLAQTAARSVMALIGVCACLAQCCPAQDAPSSKDLAQVVLQLPARHRMQFAGFYMAKELGYYREAGLEVEIRERNAEASTVDLVVMGQVEFGLSIIVNEICLHGMPLMALSTVSQYSPFVMVITGASGIHGLEDLRGRTIRSPNAALQFEMQAMLDAVGIAPDDIKLAPLPRGVDDLAGDPRGEAIFCHRDGLPVELELRKIPFTVFQPRDFGVDCYGEILFTSSAFAQRKPALVGAFREASQKGWAYAVNHMDEAVALVQAAYAPGTDRERLEREAQIVRELVMHDVTPIGFIHPQRWNACMEAIARLRHLPFNEQRSSGTLFDTAMAARSQRWTRIMRVALAGTLLAVLLLGGVALALARMVRHRTAELAYANREMRRENEVLKRTESQLRDSESIFRAVAEGAFDGCAILDTAGRFCYASSRFSLMSEYPEAELVGHHFCEMALPEDRERLLRFFERRKAGEPVKSEYETRFLRRDGKRVVPVILAVRKVMWGGQERFAVVIRDISERKRLEEEMLRIGEWEQIRIGQDLHDTIGQQLAGMAYLIGVLARNLDREKSAHAGEAQELATAADTAHQQLREVVQSLLPMMESEDLEAGLKRLCDFTSLRQGIACQLKVTAVPPNADIGVVASNHLLCIAREAIVNAVRHGNARNIDVALKRNADSGLLEIADDGSGFDVERTRKQGSGLRIMRYRADVIGGRLSIRRREGGGMSVTCEYSLSADGAAGKTLPSDGGLDARGRM